ncbi:hypothetical protein TRFO_01809 [Tritrichomonas foetus]|uniref:Uncharacterized protein n=1 Tax=Tritrichomonas foetus TaxID=1144522 RepID=A0A1J4JHY2_9EUKA|nr:hypothetical protein TRFO_01809 [Tritrichomonas foetus]|eukprot:OHS98770.1 hypothetical protein TRFO_01809 [Tritrichomonas foetus]
MENGDFLEGGVTVDRFDLLRKFGNHYWSLQSRVNKFWVIPNLGEKICLRVLELKDGRSKWFKQQMVKFAESEEFTKIKDLMDTSILPEMEMKRFFNSLIAKIDDIADKGEADYEKMGRICFPFKKLIKDRPDYSECAILINSIYGNEVSPHVADNSDKVSITSATILCILLYLAYDSLTEGLKLDKNQRPGVPSEKKKVIPMKPDAVIGGIPIVRMDALD